MKNARKLTYLNQPLSYQIYFGKMKNDLIIRHTVPMLIVNMDGRVGRQSGEEKANRIHPLVDIEHRCKEFGAPYYLVPANTALQLKVKNKTVVMVTLNTLSNDFMRLKQWHTGAGANFPPLVGELLESPDSPDSQHTLRCWLEQVLNLPDAPQQDSRVLQAAQILNQRIGINILIDKLAAEVCLSVPRFVQLFKQCTGLTVRRYRLFIRMNYAVKLVCGGASPTSAAAEAGFADYAHFSRTFKAIMGLSPREMFVDISTLSCVYHFSQGGCQLVD